MKRLLYFDDGGFYEGEDIVPEGTQPEENQYLADINEDLAFHKPKLVDGQVVEGLTEDEFLEEQLISSLTPSKEEIESAEFEIKVITLLSELEVIV